MATSVYFNNYNSSPEQHLIEDLMIETIKINGVDCFYIPNENDAARDLIFGEDPLKTFTAAYPIETYITNVEGYEGDGAFFSKFGLEIRNNMSVIISKRSFARWVPATKYFRPREGDLLYIPFMSQSGELYEIKYVNYSEAFYIMGNKYPYFYKLELEKFKYSQETIAVGIENIDDVVVQEAYNITLNMNPATGNGNYIVGETVTADNNPTVAGSVVEWNTVTGILKLTKLMGTFLSNVSVRGVTSNSLYRIVTTPDPLVDPQVREQYDNKTIETEANEIIDTSESNPFGSIS